MPKNSIEQLCINFANERLHAFFMEQVFMDELALYKREGLPVPEVNPPDNTEVCAIFDKGVMGAFQLLDSQSKAPKPTDAAFTRDMLEAHASNRFFGKVAGARENLRLNLREDEGFVVHHFAASVVYATEGFLDKNDNKISDTFEASLKKSRRSSRSASTNRFSARNRSASNISRGSMNKSRRSSTRSGVGLGGRTFSLASNGAGMQTFNSQMGLTRRSNRSKSRRAIEKARDSHYAECTQCDYWRRQIEIY